MNEVMPPAAAAADSVAISALWVKPGLPEVHLVVDASGHQPKPRAVFHFRACCQCLDVRVGALLRQVDADRHNVFPVHEDVLDLNGAVRDDVGVAKQGGLAHGRRGEFAQDLAGKKMRLNRI